MIIIHRKQALGNGQNLEMAFGKVSRCWAEKTSCWISPAVKNVGFKTFWFAFLRNRIVSPVSHPSHGKEHFIVISKIFQTVHLVQSWASHLLIVLDCQPLHQMAAIVIKLSITCICIVSNKKWLGLYGVT